MKILFAFFASFLFIGACLAEEMPDVFEQARTLVSQKKVDEALHLLREYEKAHPNDVDTHETIQRIMNRNGKKEEALAEYKQRFEKDPSGFNGYLYFRMLDVPSDREKGFREVIVKDATSVWGHYGLATALLDQDKLEQGIEEASAALTQLKEPAQLHYVIARIYRRLEDYKKAAFHMREFYRLDPTDDHRADAGAYEWLEVAYTDPFDEKFRLAQDWLKNYKADAQEDATRLAEIAFLYVEDGKDPATAQELVSAGLEQIQKEELPPPGEDRDMHLRVKGSLHALQAWCYAMQKNPSAAMKSLKQAAKAGPSSEMFFFSAISYRLLGKKEQAAQNAVKAAGYPPVYSRARERLIAIWKEVYGSEEKMEAALLKQRAQFAPQRKSRVLSQMASEKFEPFEMSDIDSKKLTEKDLSGKIVLMNFWAVWCPPCREELPHWNKFYAAHKDEPDLFFATVGDEPWETMMNYLKNQKYSFPVYRNEEYWGQFNVQGIPTLVIIDPKGKIRFRNIGFEEGMEYAETLLWQINAVRSK